MLKKTLFLPFRAPALGAPWVDLWGRNSGIVCTLGWVDFDFDMLAVFLDSPRPQKTISNSFFKGLNGKLAKNAFSKK